MAWCAKSVGQIGQGLPVIGGTDRQKHDPHGALAAHPEPPQELIRPLQVVLHGARLSLPDDLDGVFAQVSLQAAPGDEPGVVAVRGDRDQGAGLAVGRALGVHEDAERERAPATTLAFKQGQERS